MSEQTIFEACVSAVSEASDDLMSFEGDCAVVRTVIQKIIDLTQSPRTVDELTYILLNGEVSREAVSARLARDRTPDNGEEDTTCALIGEAVGAYKPGFFERMEVLKMCSGNATHAQMAWAWLNNPDAS